MLYFNRSKNNKRSKSKKNTKINTDTKVESFSDASSNKDTSKSFLQPKSPEKSDTKENVKTQNHSKMNKISRVPPSVLKENILSNTLTVEFPDNLKAWLVDDWDLITRQSYLVTLPAKKTVKDLLSDYLAFITIKQEDKTSEDDIKNVEINIECVAGLKLYFDSILGSHLLYKFERLQYGELYKRSPDKNVSYTYGAIHFLRLVVKMRELTNCMRLPGGSIKVLSDCINRILIFISEREKNYINLEDYAVAPAEYQRRAMC